jgi:hypothetical protein
MVFTDLVARFHLDGTGRLLDLAASHRRHPAAVPAAGLADRHPDLRRRRRASPGILARSPFRHVQHRDYQFTQTWTIEQAIGYLYSTSMPLHRLLGSRRAAFEQEVTDTLLAIDPAGRFTEPVTLEVLTATKR